MLASALAYASFFAIPSVLLVAVGVFTLVAGPGSISSLMTQFSHVMPAQATSLLGGSLKRLDQHPATGVAMTVVGLVLALWATTGAMTSYMTALNLAYERKDGPLVAVRKRLVALELVAVIGPAFLLVAVLLIFGPPLEQLVASHAGAASGVVGWIWWITEWPDPHHRPFSRRSQRFSTLVPTSRTRAGASSRPALSSPPRSGSRSPAAPPLHGELRLLQRDVGDARGGDHHAHLALACRSRAHPRCGDRCPRPGRSRELREGRPAERGLLVPSRSG